MRPKTSQYFRILIVLGMIVIMVKPASAANLPISIDTTGNVGQYTSMAIVHGRPAIAYYDFTGGNLKFVRANDSLGSTWGAPVSVDVTNDVGAHASLAVVSNNPAISYYDSTNGDLKFVRANDSDGANWGTPVVVDAPGSVGSFSSLAVINGFPAISYYDVTNGDLKFVRAIDSIGSAWGAPKLLDTNENVGMYTSMAVINGNPAIGYFDVTNADLKYVRASDAYGAAWDMPVNVDWVGNVGLHLSMKEIDGRPAISYLDTGTNHVKYVRAIDSNGAFWGMSWLVGEAGGEGAFTSLAVFNSLPAISYSGYPNGWVRFARANTVNGESWMEPEILDNTAAGAFTSLINNSGIMNVAFHDSTNLDLKVVISDTLSPSVQSFEAKSSYSIGPTSLEIKFSEAVLSNGSDRAANYPENYLLVEAGANQTFDTLSCAGGRTGDDTRVAIQSVTYNASNFTATIRFNDGVPLPTGQYRVWACGTTSIYDLAGNKLNNGLSDPSATFAVVLSTPTAVPASAGLLPVTGFAPGRVASLPAQPAEKAYRDAEITLEVPALGVKMPVVGVPQSADGWDVTWLGESAGWLEGSAFPTWAGNTVVTGHVWDSWNRPGPFAGLRDLRYGDLVHLRAWGETYTYQVHDSELVSARGAKAVFAHKEQDWLTLVTCERFNPLTGKYASRRVVRALRVDMK